MEREQEIEAAMTEVRVGYQERGEQAPPEWFEAALVNYAGVIEQLISGDLADDDEDDSEDEDTDEEE